MAPLKITCTGESSISARAERAIVFLTISSSGPAQTLVAEAVTKTANAVQSHLETLAPKDPDTGETHPTAPVTHYSLSDLCTGSFQPTDKDNNPVPRVFTAATRLEVTFREFAALGSFVSNLAAREFVCVERIEWRLTEATQAELGRQCRREAVKDAMMKARDYADAAGKSDYEILEITDVGVGPAWGMSKMYDGRNVPEELSFEPEEVSVKASVTATFEAA